VLVSSFVPLRVFARLRADARASAGTGRPAGRSLTVTAPRWSARASVPGWPGWRGPLRRASWRCRWSFVRFHPVMRISSLISALPPALSAW